MSELRLLELWRHPVKSLQGERLDEAGRPEVTLPDGTVCAAIEEQLKSDHPEVAADRGKVA
jgi:hypothetical protein